MLITPATTRPPPHHVGTLSMLIWIGTTIGIAVGSAADSFQDAQAMVAPTLIPLILFSGYLIPFDQIPSYFKFLYELSFFQVTPERLKSRLNPL